MVRLPQAPGAEEAKPSKVRRESLGPPPQGDSAAAAAHNALNQAAAELSAVEEVVDRIRGLLALGQSFYEAGDYGEASNLASLARTELAKATAGKHGAEGAGIRLRYVLRGMGNIEEASWIAQVERVAYDRAVRGVAEGLGLRTKHHRDTDGSEEVEFATEEEEPELRIMRRQARDAEGMTVQVTGLAGDPAVFRAFSLALRLGLAQIQEFVEKFASVPPPAEGELEEVLEVLRERRNAQVEEAIILHADGRMMCHVTSTAGPGVDYDIIGSMLLALRAFVRDSFSGDFEEVGFGERRMLLIQGEHVLGALLLRGESTESFRRAARAAIRKAEEGLRAEIVNWKGTGMIAERMLPYLEALVRGARLGSGTTAT